MNASRVPLEVLKIATPCHKNWGAMSGDAQRRFCAACNKHVHDLSAMTRSAAEELVCRSAGNLCVRMAVAADGSVVTLDYAKPVKKRRWPFAAAMTALIACVAATSSFIRKPPPRPPVMMMGEIAPMSPTLPPVVPSIGK